MCVAWLVSNMKGQEPIPLARLYGERNAELRWGSSFFWARGLFRVAVGRTKTAFGSTSSRNQEQNIND